MATILTVKRLAEIVDREIEKLCDGESTAHNLIAISKSLSQVVKANSDALRNAKDRGEKPEIPFYKEL